MTTGEPDPPGRQTAPVDPLVMALSGLGMDAGVIAHSVRGSQSASAHFESERRHRMAGSMSSVGQCWDHAVVESTFGRMKVELVHGEDYATRDEGQASISRPLRCC
jgi:transposase InsO family protein